jgi:ketosteroid isomerase-like protein
MRDRVAQMGKVVSGELVQDGLTRQGAFIYEWGHATLLVARAGAAPAQSKGRYLTVWRQGTAGRWEIIRNLSLPE